MNNKAALTRESALFEAQRLLSKPDFSKQDSSRVENLLKLADTLGAGGTELRKMRLAQISAELSQSDPSHAQRYRLVEGVRELDSVERDFNIALRQSKDALDESRALAVGTGGAGGYLVPQSFSDRLWTTLKAYDNIFDPNAVTILDSDSGESRPIPILDDGTGGASIVPENNQITEADLTFAQVTILSAEKDGVPSVVEG